MKQLTPSVWYAGTLNPNLRVFDVMMRTEYGTSYNAYLVKGSQKTALIDSSHAHFWSAFEEALAGAPGGVTPDYLILNHTEPDHSGCVAALLEKWPHLEILASQPAAMYLKNITNLPHLAVRTVKTGDSLDLGGKTLRFFSAPMLHWPDSMFTYLEEEAVVFTCDFLGAHYCEPSVLDSRVAYPAAYLSAVKHYYDCIFAPFAPFVRKGLDILAELPLAMACVSHGPVLTKEGLLPSVLESYLQWSRPPVPGPQKIPLFYCTAYGNTARLAKAVRAGILRALPGAEVQAFNLIEHEEAELAAHLNQSDAFLLGALTLNRDAAPPLLSLLSHVDAVTIAKRPAALFGSFGWSGEGFAHTAARLQNLKCRLFDEECRATLVASAADLQKAEDFGERFGRWL
jgi:flavorubredoxin